MVVQPCPMMMGNLGRTRGHVKLFIGAKPLQRDGRLWCNRHERTGHQFEMNQQPTRAPSHGHHPVVMQSDGGSRWWVEDMQLPESV